MQVYGIDITKKIILIYGMQFYNVCTLKAPIA